MDKAFPFHTAAAYLAGSSSAFVGLEWVCYLI